MKLFGRVGRGPKIDRLDFGGSPVQDPDPGFLNTHQDRDRENFIVQRC